ncbi:hypothetical protein RJ640_030006 [Escallonia rubra]|uniref:Uncharacterized protein n=1 Tax=Escallonia rubra TaxID=112253 RepID=A0AA88QLC0_9ASTE|nr:hypothetical protein RJ640_030006 [Escallonia rubra]
MAYSSISLAIVSLLFFITHGQSQTLTKQRPSNKSLSAIFIFGDSTVDPGNNNYIATIFKSNFQPYGRDFVNHTPTGRFTNGRLATDFIASYAGVKDYVPPYLDPSLSMEELMTGVSFASAGSGFDPLTPSMTGVISLPQQLEFFREWKTRVELAVGKKRTEGLIKKAAFVISAGTNDFIITYFGTIPLTRQSYSVSSYHQFLMQNIQQFVQDLFDDGAQKIAMVGLPPIGCLPSVVTSNSIDAFNQRECIERLSSIARDYNRILRSKLESMQTSGVKIAYADIYRPLHDMIQGHINLGFDMVNTGCCATGLIETSILCNAQSPVCFDASKYVFWDAVHPTERAYYIIFKYLRSTIDFVFAITGGQLREEEAEAADSAVAAATASIVAASELRISTFSKSGPFVLLLLFHVFVFISKAKSQALAKQKASNNSISAVFVFGDSTADPGNNNYISTSFKSNFRPYGRDFTNHVPTGRFSNGMLGNDFVARYVGVKDYVPPYLDPTLSIEELMTGVSFASAGSGFDPLTPSISNVISLSKQLDYFKDYQARLTAAIGKKRTKKLIRNALFLVSAGTNDFVINYFTIPIRRRSYTLPSYMDFLLKQSQQFMQGLWEQGARKIGVVGLPPMGCLPIVITLYSDNAFLHRGCVEFFSSVAATYNSMVKNELNSMQARSAKYGSRIAYMDVFETLTEMTMGHKFDFDEVSRGCCGTGLMEALFLCNPNTFVCPDANKYVFWDSIHPTEKAYYILFKILQPVVDSIIKD